MPAALIVSGALANFGPEAPQDESLEYLVEQAPDVAVFRRVRTPGSITGAAFDWQGVLGTGADLIAYAGVLWGAYGRFVGPRLEKRRDGPEPSIFVSVRRPDGTFAQFSINREFDDQDLFVEVFVAQVSELRSGHGEKDDELLSEFSHQDRWVRIEASDRKHPSDGRQATTDWHPERCRPGTGTASTRRKVGTGVHSGKQCR